MDMNRYVDQDEHPGIRGGSGISRSVTGGQKRDGDPFVVLEASLQSDFQ